MLGPCRAHVELSAATFSAKNCAKLSPASRQNPLCGLNLIVAWLHYVAFGLILPFCLAGFGDGAFFGRVCSACLDERLELATHLRALANLRAVHSFAAEVHQSYAHH